MALEVGQNQIRDAGVRTAREVQVLKSQSQSIQSQDYKESWPH